MALPTREEAIIRHTEGTQKRKYVEAERAVNMVERTKRFIDNNIGLALDWGLDSVVIEVDVGTLGTSLTYLRDGGYRATELAGDPPTSPLRHIEVLLP